MKMSDVFDLSDKSGIGFSAYWSDDKVRMASKAINNYDTLTETNRLLNLECEELKGELKEFLPMYHYDSNGDEHYIGGSFEWTETESDMYQSVMKRFGYGELLDK